MPAQRRDPRGGTGRRVDARPRPRSCARTRTRPAPVPAAGPGPAPAPAPEPDVKFPLPRPSEIGAEKFALLLNTFLSQEKYAGWPHDAKPRFTGPYIVKDSGEVESFGSHGTSAVQVYYSPEVWAWLQAGRKGTIPDGGMLVKALFARNPDEPTQYSKDLTGFSVSVKDSKGSWDGWFYSDGGPLTKPVLENGAQFFDPNVGFGLSCVNCHGTADNAELTYSSLRNVTGTPIQHTITISKDGLKKKLLIGNDIHNPVPQPRPAPEGAVPDMVLPFGNANIALSSLQEPIPLTISTLDHVPQGPKPAGQLPFVTASNCNTCHDAVQLYSSQPHMTIDRKNKLGETERVNLSSFSEWRYSMMGLSGRDPVFYSQLDSERSAYPELASEIDNTCLSCHAPMGARQWKHDFGADKLFPMEAAHAEPGTKNEKYGALSRDGVSCMICHQMAPVGMGEPKTFSGNFKLLAKPGMVFGPYEKTTTLAMDQTVGLTPSFGPHMSDSKLCASCHTIALPVLEAGKKYSSKEFGELSANIPSHGFHEQATYLEWKNSSYSTESPVNRPLQRSCQDCHMPKTFNGEKLKFKIANIEDDTFPPVDHRAKDELIRMEPRDNYARHSLHGINLFSMEMFNQNAWLLGVSRKDNLLPAPNAVSGYDIATESAQKMAREETAKVEIIKARRIGRTLSAQVKVTNLTGHKFPSGVNFRRAFIEFKVESNGKTLWLSGGTDSWGVIGTFNKEKFTALKTEFLKDNSFQPHRQRIEREDEVQIYESLIADTNGNLTTSFMSLKTPVKDNRLLPLGWKSDGPDADLTKPMAVGNDPDYRDGEGKDIVLYEFPLDIPDGQPLTVSATLYYQSLPPYYLKQRFEIYDKPDTQSLYFMINKLDLRDTPIENWKLSIAKDSKKVE